MYRVLRYLVLAWALLSCAHSPSIVADGRTCAAPCSVVTRFRIDPRFTYGQQAAIYQAMLLWNEATGGRQCYTNGNDLVIVKADTTEFLRPWDPGYRHHQGLFRQGTIFLVTDIDDAALELVAVHELGHAEGLDHSIEPQSIMAAQAGSLDPEGHIRQDSAGAWCQIHGCQCE
jgi:hypothetical protein